MTFDRMTLAALIAFAYGVELYQVSCPDWIKTARFDIVAKVPTGATRNDVPIMLRNLLAERFALRVHREATQAMVYRLVVDDRGAKLNAPASGNPPETGAYGPPRLATDGFPEMAPNTRGMLVMNGHARWQAPSGTVDQLAAMLARELQSPVINATGLEGRYSLSLFWVTEAAASAPVPGTGGETQASTELDIGPTIFIAVRRQLGLRLLRGKGLADLLVVDHCATRPIEN
jgi:uncharacterized protein (TIGR03435 family)